MQSTTMRAGLGLLLLGVLSAGATEDRRRVSLEFNPGFNESSVNLLHIRAVGSNSTIHYVWSTIGTPTVLLIYTDSVHSRLQINWTKLTSEAPYDSIHIQPAESVRYSTALLFTRLYEYNDVNNTANFSGIGDKYFYTPYDLSDFLWENANVTLNATTLSANLTGHNASGSSFKNSSLTFRVKAYESTGRDSSPPQLLHTANYSKLEFLLDGILPRGNRSRFALEMITLEMTGRKKIQSVRSIDDEYTPTIFEVAQLVPDSPNTSDARGFFQWKSVAYGSTKGSREDSLPCQFYQLQSLNKSLAVPSIAYAYFGEHLHTKHHLQAFNISFGISEGDFYEKNKFLSWSALVGYGSPHKDSFSILVICIMAVALGTPVLILILGGIVVALMKNRVYSNYEPIN